MSTPTNTSSTENKSADPRGIINTFDHDPLPYPSMALPKTVTHLESKPRLDTPISSTPPQFPAQDSHVCARSLPETSPSEPARVFNGVNYAASLPPLFDPQEVWLRNSRTHEIQSFCCAECIESGPTVPCFHRGRVLFMQLRPGFLCSNMCDSFVHAKPHCTSKRSLCCFLTDKQWDQVLAWEIPEVEVFDSSAELNAHLVVPTIESLSPPGPEHVIELAPEVAPIVNPAPAPTFAFDFALEPSPDFAVESALVPASGSTPDTVPETAHATALEAGTQFTPGPAPELAPESGYWTFRPTPLDTLASFNSVHEYMSSDHKLYHYTKNEDEQ